MKKILFVINTLGQAGAETALAELLCNINPEEYEVSLLVLMEQGEMIRRIPKYVKVLNNRYSELSVLSKEGKKQLNKTVLHHMFAHGSVWKNIPYLFGNLCAMIGKGRIQPDKSLWRIMADGAMRVSDEYDIAVAYLEGGAAYYVDKHVKAKKKVGFIHIDYSQAGYTRKLDKNCYDGFQNIFTVSDEVKKHFLEVYPEYKEKTDIFHNMMNQEKIRRMAKETGGFEDDYKGKRILTVGRLTPQKAYEVSIEAMKLLQQEGHMVRWYVLGEGEMRKSLEQQIARNGLQEEFLLLGAKDNPYPYMAQTDLYVHCTRFEGKSIAIQEAQTLGCAILVSDCNGNREQVEHGVDGWMCNLTPEDIKNAIVTLLQDEKTTERIKQGAVKKIPSQKCDLDKLLSC